MYLKYLQKMMKRTNGGHFLNIMVLPNLCWTGHILLLLLFSSHLRKEKCHCKDGYHAPELRAVYALRHHLLSRGKNKQNQPRGFSPKGHANYRLTNQGGLFLKMPQNTDLESWVQKNFENDTYKLPPDVGENLHPKLILQKFIIPDNENERIECLTFLDHMNINRASLFPDLDGAARYVNDLWEVNFDTAIGHIGDE